MVNVRTYEVEVILCHISTDLMYGNK